MTRDSLISCLQKVKWDAGEETKSLIRRSASSAEAIGNIQVANCLRYPQNIIFPQKAKNRKSPWNWKVKEGVGKHRIMALIPPWLEAWQQVFAHYTVAEMKKSSSGASAGQHTFSGQNF